MTRQKILNKLLLGETIAITETREELNCIHRVHGKIADIRRATSYESVKDIDKIRLVIYCVEYEQTIYRFIYDDDIESLVKGEAITCNVSREMLQLC